MIGMELDRDEQAAVFASVEQAIEDFAAGRMVIIVATSHCLPRRPLRTT